MAIKSTYTRVLVDRHDLSGNSNNVELTVEANALEYNVFQTPATQSIPGDPTTQIAHSGYFTTPVAGQLEQYMYTLLGYTATTSLLGVILGTDQAIPLAYVMESPYNGQLKVESKTNSLITVAGLWNPQNVQLYRGYQLWAGNISATGAKTGVDFGSAGAAGGKAWLWFHTNVGTVTSGTITVQSDDNAGFTTPTTRGTFTFSTAGTHQFSIDLAAVERYMRINATSMGGGTSYNVTVAAGTSGQTY